MTAEELLAMRKHLELTQAEMATGIGLTGRAYQMLESGASALTERNRLAIERFALALAVERKDPMLAPASVRRDALELARMINHL